MRVIVFGAKGQLGKALLQVFSEQHTVMGYDLPELDISDNSAVECAISQFQPDLVINAAAFTDVEKAESARADAFRVNEAGARNVASAASRQGVPVVYYSTDFVFDGEKRSPYEPDDSPSPLGVYAKSKHAGEQAVIATTSKYFVVRTAWLFGPGGNHFVGKIISAAQTRPELRVVEDEVGSPTYTLDLASATRDLCRAGQCGIYHIVNAGFCSRFEFAKAILEYAGIGTPVRPCRSADFPSAARRPAYSVLSTAKFERVTGTRLRHWREALRDYLERRKDQG